jgi:PAS domain S-box-containing protein
MMNATAFEYEYDVIRDNGEVRSLWSRGRVDRDASGKPPRIYGITQDITERKVAENLLRDREGKLAEAQRIAHLGSWDWDVANSRFVWSDELFRIVGLDPSRASASYEDYMNRIHPDDRTATTERVSQGLRDGIPFESEHRIVRDNGDIRTVWTSCRMEKDITGKVVRMYGIAQDVTDRKRAEEALRTSEHRFRSLYTQAPVMMIAFGSDGRIREVSNYWLKVMGYERHDVIGQEGYKFITPDSQERLQTAMERTVREGERVLRNFPLVGVRKDGRTLDILCTSVLEMDERGQSLGAIAVGVDVTDIRRAEEAIRESEARYRALVENAAEAIVVLDVETGKFIDANTHAEVMFGYSREKLLTMGPLDFCPRMQAGGISSHDLAWDNIGRVMRGETPIFEFVHTHESGREIPCQIRLVRLPATGQNLIRASLTDISELKALEQQVRHGEKMAAVGLLAAGVAHEIGNPLLALSMAAQSLERKSSDEYAQKKLGLIREHIDRISKIVRQMSDLARPQSAQRNPCDVNRVLERTLEVVRYDKRAKEVPIKFDPCPDVPFVQAVEDQLTQVCLNLALNALDAVATNPQDRPKSLHIRARCVQKGGRTFVRASFKDSGPGIPEAARSKIFQPFYTTKSAGKGTGLGLSVSYRIIQEHQGTLAFDCGSKDGTEFYFELPV